MAAQSGAPTGAEAASQRSPYLVIAIALIALSALVYGGLSLIFGTRGAHERRVEIETSLTASTDFAARAVEARLQLLMERARAQAPQPAAPPPRTSGHSLLPRLE